MHRSVAVPYNNLAQKPHAVLEKNVSQGKKFPYDHQKRTSPNETYKTEVFRNI
jgi:hypothetical protein